MKNKGCKEESNGGTSVKILAPNVTLQNDDPPVMKLEINNDSEENEGLMIHCCDLESPSNSPISHTSSVFGSHFTTTSSSSSSSGGCCSESMTEEDDGENECLDDWEAIADALEADDMKKKNNNVDPNLESHVREPTPQLAEPDPVTATKVGQGGCCARAWRPDDVFRPQSLPNLIKQNSFPMNSGWTYGGSSPSTCPVCCEDLDLTDKSFLPCPCGYRLSLFCHKRILEDDARCPGCRKQYVHHGEGNVSLKMGRSYSMIPRH